MILPIYAYGFPVLKKIAEEIEKDDADLQELINNMWETMYNANGVGLAAPQVGISKRLFLVDTIQLKDEEKSINGIKKVFINAIILEEDGELWPYEEGCLSIPKLTGDVERQEKIVVEYYDEDFQKHIDSFDGMNARVIQHEYDHTEGILFTERLKPLKRRLIARKLDQIKNGDIDVSYKMKFKV